MEHFDVFETFGVNSTNVSEMKLKMSLLKSIMETQFLLLKDYTILAHETARQFNKIIATII